MQEYEIYETETFSKIFDSITQKERDWINKIKFQLKSNPKAGKSLRFEWFKEKKLENKRLYFLVSYKKPRILLASYGTKKDQQKVIDYIVLHKEELMAFLDNF